MKTVHAMNTGNVLVEAIDDLPILKVNFRHFDHVPSWKRCVDIKDGCGWLECTGHQAAGWVSFVLGESYVSEKGGGTSRDTSIALPREQVAVLRDMLNRVLDGDGA